MPDLNLECKGVLGSGINIEKKGKNNFLDCVQLGCDYAYSRW